MTRAQRADLASLYAHAQERAERAKHYGDRAGYLIARGDARRILARLSADR